MNTPNTANINTVLNALWGAAIPAAVCQTRTHGKTIRVGSCACQPFARLQLVLVATSVALVPPCVARETHVVWIDVHHHQAEGAGICIHQPDGEFLAEVVKLVRTGHYQVRWTLAASGIRHTLSALGIPFAELGARSPVGRVRVYTSR